MSNIKVYVANLGKYNEGKLVGGWITLPVDNEDLIKFLVETVDINSRHEEYAIHDYECDFMEIGEYESVSKLNEVAELLEGLDDYQKNVLKAIKEWGWYSNTNITEIIENIDNFVLYEDIEHDYDLGEYMAEESGIYDLSAMGSLSNYIDYAKLGRDIYLEGEWFNSSYGYIQYIG